MTADYQRDYWQEYKDDLASGYINEDGSPREPDETAWLEAKARQEHLDETHDGGECDCPPFDLDAWLAQQTLIHRDQEHGGGKCDCPPGQPPF